MRNGKAIIGWTFGLALLGFVLWKFDVRQTVFALSQVNPFWFLAVIFFTVLTQLFGYIKWTIMYRATMDDRKQPLLPIFASILVVGMLTPARSGDLIASLAWKKMQGRVLAWSVFHRISEGIITIILSLCILGVFFSSFLSKSQWIIASCFILMIILGILLVLNRRLGRVFFGFLRDVLLKMQRVKIAQKILTYEEKVKGQFELFYATMFQFKTNNVLFPLVSLTIFNRFVIIILNMVVLLSLGVHLPWSSVLGILAVIWVSAFISPTPNGIGVSDLASGMMLSGFGFAGSVGGYIIINRFFELAIILFWLTVSVLFKGRNS